MGNRIFTSQVQTRVSTAVIANLQKKDVLNMSQGVTLATVMLICPPPSQIPE